MIASSRRTRSHDTLLGPGPLTAISTLPDFGVDHLPSRIAALVAIGLGLWMIRDILLPDAWKRAPDEPADPPDPHRS